MKCFKHFTEFATGGCPECKREYMESQAHQTCASTGSEAPVLSSPREQITAPVTKVFEQRGDFHANYAAEEWLQDNGYSYGRMQGDAPRGILRGDLDIQKWRNLRPAERDALCGTMTGDFRHGPVTVEIRK